MCGLPGGAGERSEDCPYPRSKGEILNMKPGEDEGEHKQGGTEGIHKVRSDFWLWGKVRESTFGFGRLICSNLEEVG